MLSTSRDPSLEVTDMLLAGGFTPTRTEILDLEPPVVCVIAVDQGPVLMQG